MPKKKELTLEDLQSQYEAFCENVRAVKQNTYWRTAFNKIGKGTANGQKENKKTL